MTEAIIGYIVSALKKIWCWFLGKTADLAGWGWDWLTSLLPTIPDSQTGSIAEIAPLVNCWIPLDQILICFVAWAALRGAITLYRVVKSWIPALGG